MAGSPIENKSLSFDKVLDDLKTYVQSLPDYARWKDFYASSAGATFLELLAGTGAYLSFHSLASRRESYLETAKLKSSVYNMATMLGYEPNRRTAPVFRVHLLKNPALFPKASDGFVWPSKNVPIATYNGYNLVTLDTIKVLNRQEMAGKVFDICMGDWTRQEQVVEETKPFLKMFIEDNSIDNSLDHIYVTVLQSSNSMAQVPLRGVRYAEELVPPDSETKVLIRSSYDGVTLVFGDGSFGYKVGMGDVVRVEYLSTVGRPAVSVSSESLRESLSWNVDWLGDVVDYIEVLSPGYEEDSLDKIRSLASGYFAARRRMLTVSDHNAVLMSYPDVVSAGTRRKGYGDGLSCCIVQMCPLFEDEHVINSEDREVAIDSVELEEGVFKFTVNSNYDLRLFTGGYNSSTIQYPNLSFKLYVDKGQEGSLTGLSQYPTYYVISDITDRTVADVNGETVVTPATFKLKDPVSLEYIGGEELPEWEKGTLMAGANDYLAQDRSVGGLNRTTVVTSWNYGENLEEGNDTLTLANDTDLVDGARVGFAFGGALLEDGSEVCLPEPLMSTLLANPEAEWTVERVDGESLMYRLLDENNNPIVFSNYKINVGSNNETEISPKGTVMFKWKANTDSALTEWNVENNTVVVKLNNALDDNQLVWFSGIDPDMHYYRDLPVGTSHLPYHDPVSVGNDWDKPWGRTVRGSAFVPLWLPRQCYTHYGWSQNGNGPQFLLRLKAGTTDEYELYDLSGNRLTITNAGVGKCWVCWSKEGDKDNYGTREQRSIMLYMEDMKVAGEVIELVDPVKVILQMKMTVVVEDAVTVSELETQIQEVLQGRIKRLGKTFRPGEVVAEVSKLDGVKRVYLKYPTSDKELDYNQYIGFDEGTYLDLRIREAIFGDINHYIAPLDLNITTNESTIVDMVPDATKGYYEEI